MSRFHADTTEGRRELIVDAIRAHRDRGSRFTTFQTPADHDDAPDPWIQYAAPETLVNLDCTDDEFARLDALLEEFGGCTIRERTTPEDAEGTNVRIEMSVDDDRVAQFVDRCFRKVYDRPSNYHLWVTTI